MKLHLQNYLNHLIKWSQSSDMHFNTAKHKLIHWGYMGYSYTMSNPILKCSDSGKGYSDIITNYFSLSSRCSTLVKLISMIYGFIK